MKARRKLIQKPTMEVGAVLRPGAGRWLLLFCEHGHLQKMFAYGDWSDARRRYGRAKSTVHCMRCANGKA